MMNFEKDIEGRGAFMDQDVCSRVLPPPATSDIRVVSLLYG